ncbi:MAG: hypothetical protein EA402_11450 [Planctomycetota bacterium]|nr:MAG: hypothetical protein EA402_11450 [Planctomycetota bacterium]
MLQRFAYRACGLILCTMAALGAGEVDDLIVVDDQGRRMVRLEELPAELRNPWPVAVEEAFRDRVQLAIEHNSNRHANYGNTFFENERKSYPPAIFDALFGSPANRQRGLQFLQSEDNQARSWNAVTEGIDFFPAHTLKNQMRKYFLLAPLLDVDYRLRMRRGASLWTAKDPYMRPHPSFQREGGGWTPHNRNSWVDVRNTDNLRAMREVAVYLMAEETGNHQVRDAYAAAIRRYVWALWHIGAGEWDSDMVHQHSIAAYLNLFDFARDPAMRQTAKAALDMLFTMAAVKYFDGGMAGPSKRDQNLPVAFNGAAGDLWLMFGGSAAMPEHIPVGTIHLLSSAYRPPYAVWLLAQKAETASAEIFASKPTYETWVVEGPSPAGKGYPADHYQVADHRPEFFETTFFTRHYQMGSLPQGSHGDINGFRILMRCPQHGAQYFGAAAVEHFRSVMRGSGQERIAQHRNLALVLSEGEQREWSLLIPAQAGHEEQDNIRFLQVGETYLALHPIRLSWRDGRDLLDTETGWAHLGGWRARAQRGGVSGLAIEVANSDDFRNFGQFQRAVSRHSQVEISGRKVRLHGHNGLQLAMEVDGWPVRITRGDDATPFNDRSRWPLYQRASGEWEPLRLDWKTGALSVRVGNHHFFARYGNDHRYITEFSDPEEPLAPEAR